MFDRYAERRRQWNGRKERKHTVDVCFFFSSRLIRFCYFLWPNFIGWSWAFYYFFYFLPTLYSFQCVQHCAAAAATTTVALQFTTLCHVCVQYFCFNTSDVFLFSSLMHSFIPSNVDLIRLFGLKYYCPSLGMLFVMLITSSSCSCDFLSPLSVPKKNYSDELSLWQVFFFCRYCLPLLVVLIMMIMLIFSQNSIMTLFV